MATKFSDFSQLKKSFLKSVESPAVKPEPPLKPKPSSREEREADETLAYFSHTSITARGYARPKGVVVTPPTARRHPAEGSGTQASGAIPEAEESLSAANGGANTVPTQVGSSAAEEELAALRRLLDQERAKSAKLTRQVQLLKDECGRLQGQLNRFL